MSLLGTVTEENYYNGSQTFIADGSTSTVEYVEIASLGNGMTFGNSRTEVYRSAGCSNGHGGL